MATPNLHFSLLILGDRYKIEPLVSGIINGFPQDYSNSHLKKVHHFQVDGQDVTLEMYIEEEIVEQDLNLDSASFIYPSIKGIIALYDITDRESFILMLRHLRDMDINMLSICRDYPIMCVGTNIENESERMVTKEHLSQVIDTVLEEVKFMEVSTVTGENVETALQTITRDMIARTKSPQAELEPTTLVPVKTKSKKCIVS